MFLLPHGWIFGIHCFHLDIDMRVIVELTGSRGLETFEEMSQYPTIAIDNVLLHNLNV